MLYEALLEDHCNRQFSKSFTGPKQRYDLLTRTMFCVFLNTILIHCQTDYYGGLLSIYFLLITPILLPQDDDECKILAATLPREPDPIHPGRESGVYVFHKDFSCLFETVGLWTTLLGKIALRVCGSKVNKGC